MGKISLHNFICHLSWLEKLSPTHTHTLISICEFLKPYKLLFFELESLIKCWMWIGKKLFSLINIICHLSWLNKLSPAHTHPLISISEFLKPYKLLFFELESLIKSWMWIPLRDPPTPLLHDTPHPTPPYPPPHPFMTHPPHLPPPHPFMTHWSHPTPPHPTPGTFLGTKEPFFMGCFTMSPSR